jgi:hypothetical protein
MRNDTNYPSIVLGLREELIVWAKGNSGDLLLLLCATAGFICATTIVVALSAGQLVFGWELPDQVATVLLSLGVISAMAGIALFVSVLTERRGMKARLAELSNLHKMAQSLAEVEQPNNPTTRRKVG